MTSTPGLAGRGTPVAGRAGLEVRNWGTDLFSRPAAVVEARCVDDIVAVLKDAERYPAPVRAIGSGHSTTRCQEADGGTVVRMRGMNRILAITADTVSAEAGAQLIDVAKALQQRQLQLFVNIELGNATLGSVACCATKDASMPGEYGQLNSYCVGMKLVTPSGEIVEITEDDPELLQLARSSYGLFGIVYETTFRVRPLQAMSVEHEVYDVAEFKEKLPALVERGQSMMFYIFPFLNRIAVEFREYTGDAGTRRPGPNRFVWRLRNKVWKSVGPGFGYVAQRFIPLPALRFFLVDRFNGILQLTTRVLKSSYTLPTDQMIRYPDMSNWTRYTFSIWAFPAESYADTLVEYCAFAQDYYRRVGWRVNMIHVGYRILHDQSSLFSYSWDGDVMTIDPVSTGAPGWREFLHAYNEFCSQHGGTPLLNQSWGLTREQVERAFGERVARFEQARRNFDPGDRLLNPYFRELLEAPA